jgi:DNA-binding MarR family transcriptional regulator
MLDDRIEREMIRASTTVGEHYYAAAAAVGLTVQEARLLFILGLQPRNMLGLTEALRVPKSTMTGLITRMETAGLITRKQDPADRRHLVSAPTAKGKDVAATFSRDLASRVNGVLSVLEPGERNELADILNRLLRTMEPPA